MRFSIRDVFWLFTVGLILALLYVKGPPPPPPPRHPPLMPNSTSAVGRYQMATDPKSGHLLLLDTESGRIWKVNAEEWGDGKSPSGTP